MTSLRKEGEMKIVRVMGREIFDSRGMPTIECEIVLENGFSVAASVPTGASRSAYEAKELRDGGLRLMGKGVLKSIQIIEQLIEPVLIGREPNVIEMDQELVVLDDTDDKSKLGANTILATSIAICKAQAFIEALEPYELIAHLCGYDMAALPFPMFNVINGGAHAYNKLRFQEFMIMPVGVPTIHEALEISITFFSVLKKILEEQGFSTAVGDEGGFAPDLDHETQALDLIMEAMSYVQNDFGGSLMIAVDVAASQFYNKSSGLYTLHGRQYSSDELIGYYGQLIDKYPLYSLEDGLDQDDWDGWQKLTAKLGSRLQIVGDDIFATNANRIYEGIDRNVANTVVIKPNQVGTLTETLQSIQLCKEHDRNVIVSHRSGETNDSFIADIAVGTSAGQIKAGGLTRGERMAKYNRLLMIEDELLQVE